MDGDPLADITPLANPAHVVGVWKVGRQVKGIRGILDAFGDGTANRTRS